MELFGFFYEHSDEKIPAEGKPRSRELIRQGFVQKNNAKGEPRWYVKPNMVWFLVELDGKIVKFNVYSQILDLYPERQRISLRLAQEVVEQVLKGKITINYKNGNLYLKKE